MDKHGKCNQHSRVSATRLWPYYKRAKGFGPSTCGLESHRSYIKAIALAIVYINSWLTVVNNNLGKIAYICPLISFVIGQNDTKN